MIAVSFRDFLAIGAFGPIRLGMTREEIVAHLGEPANWGTEKYKRTATIWRYADIEFYFTDHRLRMIFTDHDSLVNGGDTCMIDPWIVSAGLRRVDLESALSDAGIEFTGSQSDFDPDLHQVVTASGIELGFDEPHASEWPDVGRGLFTWNFQTR